MKKPLLKALWGAGGARLLAGDIALVLLLAAGAATVLPLRSAVGEKPDFADVELSGRQSFRLAVAENAVREALGPLGATRIEVRDGRIRVLSSPCPLKVCVKTGWIDAAGEMIVCLPNEVVVRLPGNLPGNVDAMSR